uniref:(California timema) hypothetical protein n=1 Tax=Timema californicum TaxID=61474 RepID=A0A7R9JAJ9_TIMCA|nr:unnamed protein product [Timema californicum]
MRQRKQMYPYLRGGRVETNFGKTTFSTLNRDSNLDIPIIDSIVYCGISALDHVATEER